MRKVVMLLALAAIPCAAMAQDRVAGPAEIASIIKRLSAPPADAFTVPHDQMSVVGTKVRVEIPVHNGDLSLPDDANNLVTWKYRPAEQKLIVGFHPSKGLADAFSEADRDLMRPLTPVGFTTGLRERSADGGTRSNAYGVAARVVTTSQATTGIAHFSTDFFGRDLLPGVEPDGLEYSKVVDLVPADARRITKTLRLVAEGEVVPFAPGRTVVCGTSYSAPTIANPHESAGEHCYLSVAFARISFVDIATGQVLATWKRTADKN